MQESEVRVQREFSLRRKRTLLLGQQEGRRDMRTESRLLCERFQRQAGM